jgi:hypothetical protein
MIITLTLQSAYTGNTNIGPFTVSGTTNGGGANAINMTTGSIPTAQLINGWSYNDSTDTITGGTIASSGTCNTTVHWTMLPTGFYYNIQQKHITCGGGIGSCTGNIGGNLIGYSTIALTVGQFYNSAGDVYEIVSTTNAQTPDLTVTTWAGSGYVNCGDAAQC